MKYSFLIAVGFFLFSGCATLSPERKLASTSDLQDPCQLRSFCQGEPESLHWSVLNPGCEHNRFFNYDTRASKNFYKRGEQYQAVAIPAITEFVQFDSKVSAFAHSETGEKYYGKDYTNKVFCGDALYIGFTFTHESNHSIGGVSVTDQRVYMFNNTLDEPHLNIQDQPILRKPVGDDDGYLDSQSRNMTMMFFPRKQSFSIRPAGADELEVTLPTGESVFIDSVQHTIKAGVLKEKPIGEMNYRISDTKNVEVTYHGTGISLKAVKRASSEKLNTQVEISNPSKAQSCQVPSSELWKSQNGGVDQLRFIFHTDEAFYTYLKEKCPKVAP